MHKESLSKLSKRNLMFKVPMISKNENFAGRVMRSQQKSQMFLNWTSKKIPDWRKCCFLKIEKSDKLLHPTVQTTMFCIACFLSLNYIIGIPDRHGKQFSNRDSNLICLFLTPVLSFNLFFSSSFFLNHCCMYSFLLLFFLKSFIISFFYSLYFGLLIISFFFLFFLHLYFQTLTPNWNEPL